jgi:hypothetical protein
MNEVSQADKVCNTSSLVLLALHLCSRGACGVQPYTVATGNVRDNVDAASASAGS